MLAETPQAWAVRLAGTDKIPRRAPMSGDMMIPMTLASPVLHLAEEGGGSGGSGWWWLLLLLIIPVAAGGWLYAKRDRTKDQIVHPPRPESNDPGLPKVNLAATAPDPLPQAPTPPAGPVSGGTAEVSLNPAPAPKRTVTGDGVGSYLNADGERVPVPIGGHLPLVADAQQAPDGYPIKGDADTGLYHVPDDPWFGDVIAAVWLASEPAARAAGFKRAGTAPEQAAEES
ncbi:sunset domain-containing protein [Gordonia iterans]